MSFTEILIENPRTDMQLGDFRAQIAREAKIVEDVKSHSYNVIAITLRQIAQKFGDTEANKAITDFKLERLGWNCKVCDHCGHWPCGCGG